MNEITIQDKIVYTVDDDADVLTFIQAILKRDGMTAKAFSNGEDMFANIHNQLPDLILLDIDMPGGMDGFEVCAHLKSEKDLKDIPVIFLSGANDIENKIKGFEVGAKDFIPKPVLAGELIARVRTHLVASLLENKLRESQAKYKSIMASMIDFLFIVSTDGMIEYMNPVMTKRFGKETIGKYCYNVILGLNEPCTWCDLGSKDKNASMGFHFTSPADQRRYNMTHMPIQHEDGRVSTMVIMRDETDYWNAKEAKENSERELMHTQKTKAIGQLAAGIAHEINTPIQYIRDNMDFLQSAFADFLSLAKNSNDILDAVKSNSASPEIIKKLETAIENCDLAYHEEEIPSAIKQSIDGSNIIKNIVQAMKEFSQPGKEKVLTDINHQLENTITISKNKWKYVAEITTEFDEELPNIFCQQNEINQVFLNLILNASQAVEDAIGRTPLEKGSILIKTQFSDGWAQILFIDTGTGISIENQNHIFDPFFTTREVGAGTGLGLTIAHDIVVKKHNGKLEVTSEPEKGSTFIISLPVSLQ